MSRLPHSAKLWISFGVVASGLLLLLLFPAYRYRQAVGPLKLRFRLPVENVGRREAILSTGKVGQGVIAFYIYPDKSHLQIGLDIWGRLYQSEPVAIAPGQQQELVLEFSALYPRSHPRLRDLTAFQRDALRQRIRADLNGATIIQANGYAYESTPNQIYLGGSAIGGSLAGTEFHGELVSSSRLPIPTTLTLIENTTVLVWCDVSDTPIGQKQPLFTATAEQDSAVGYEIRTSPGSVRFGFQDQNGRSFESPELSVANLIDVSYVLGRDPKTGKLSASIVRKGQRLAGDEHPTDVGQALVVHTGVNARNLGGIAARFTGTRLKIAENIATSNAAQRIATTGAYDLYVTFPDDKLGHAEPLVVTGKPGAADLVYVRYIDAGHIQFATDHWSVGGEHSEVLPVDYALPHRVTISLGSLYRPIDSPPSGVAPPLPAVVYSTLEISLDGRIVLHTDAAPYPAKRTQIWIGENRIGASSCEESFSGDINLIRRVGSPAVLSSRSGIPARE